MRNNLVFPNDTNEPKVPNELLKTTALIYFKEALGNQQYEQCAELINKAKGFGARQADIRRVINGYLNKGKTGRQDGAVKKIGGRLRFL